LSRQIDLLFGLFEAARVQGNVHNQVSATFRRGTQSGMQLIFLLVQNVKEFLKAVHDFVEIFKPKNGFMHWFHVK
jgi:hypothetical protein